MTFGERLAGWRRESGWTQDALAASIDKSRAYVAALEGGRSDIAPPDRVGCNAIAAALGLDPEAVWLAAAPERLRRYDADLAAWVESDGPASALLARVAELEARVAVLEQAVGAVRAAVEGV